jgi:alpha-1,6-mannosyltransferase
MSFISIQTFLDIILIISTTYMLLISPYTKVEESFNVQAIHDIINVGVDQIELFDHLTFSGVVKRTSIGALFFSLPLVYFTNSAKKWASYLISLALFIHSILPTPLHILSNTDIYNLLMETKIHQLILARFLLSLCVSLSMIYLRKSLLFSCSKNSKLISIWFSLLFYPLPHILYYSSRFLPNIICFPLTNIAVGMFLSGDIARSLAIFSFTGIVFRFEILIFASILGFLCVTGILRNGPPILSIRELSISSIISIVLSCLLSGRVDSYFWNVEFTLPEFQSFFFNVIKGKSSEWGTESPFSYFIRYLPKIFAPGFEIVLILSTVFIFFSFLNIKSIFHKKYKLSYQIDYVNYGVGTITTLMWSSIIYLIILSINGHKEWRFLIYTIPIFCSVAASTFEWIYIKANKSFKFILIIIITTTYITNLLSTFLFGLISSWNYGGGDAAQILNLRLIDLYESNTKMLKPITVHWDVGTCMNGASLFTQLSNNKNLLDAWLINDDIIDNEKYWIIYDKTENPTELINIIDTFDYWVQYDDEKLLSLNGNYEWMLIDIIEGYNGINKEFIIRTLKNPKTFVLQLLNCFQTNDFTWFYKLFDLSINKTVKFKIWERSIKNENNGLH